MQVLDEYKVRAQRVLWLIQEELHQETHSWDELEEAIQTARYLAEILENWQITQHKMNPVSSLSAFNRKVTK